MKLKQGTPIFSIVMIALVGTWVGPDAADAKSKYGSKLVPLSQDSSYFREAKAPDFWAQIPFYTAQRTGSSCSTAAVATMMNGLRDSAKLSNDIELITEESVLAKAGVARWRKQTAKGGSGIKGLDEMKGYVEAVLKGHGLSGYTVEAVHAENADEGSVAAFRKVLIQNEKSKEDFIVLNFLQSGLTEDADAGHVAPLGAYDRKQDRVLVLDVDREWYEPYWAKTEDVVKAMATLDKGAGKNRGYLWVRKGK